MTDSVTSGFALLLWLLHLQDTSREEWLLLHPTSPKSSLLPEVAASLAHKVSRHPSHGLQSGAAEGWSG